MDLSIITTLYRSSPFIQEFHRRASEAARKFGAADYEVLLVNDGSPDDSLDIAMELQRQDQHVVVVDLSRNFGHHKAMMTGLMQARGERVFLIDCDLEEAPELLEVFAVEIERTGADVVFGQQARRKGGWFERVSGEVFYRLLNCLSTEPIPRNAITARLMTRRYVQSMTQHRDRALFFAGVLATTGFKQVGVPVVKQGGAKSTYGLARKMALLVNAVTSFSNWPLVFIFYSGLAISALSLCGAAYLVFRRLLFGEFVIGWPSLIVSIWLLGGFTIMCVGIIGAYLAKIFIEVKDRPYTVVRAVHRKEDGPAV